MAGKGRSLDVVLLKCSASSNKPLCSMGQACTCSRRVEDQALAGEIALVLVTTEFSACFKIKALDVMNRSKVLCDGILLPSFNSGKPYGGIDMG